MLDTFPKLIAQYADLIKKSTRHLKEKPVLVDRETRKIRVPPLTSDIALFGVPLQPLLTAYHGIEGIDDQEALRSWDDLALSIADNAASSAVMKLATSVFPTCAFSANPVAIGTQYLVMCARAEIGKLHGDAVQEIGLKRGRQFIGFTRRAVYLNDEHLFTGKSSTYRSRVRATRALNRADFSTAYNFESNPILLRPNLAGVRALMIEAYPDDRPGIDIVLGVISTSNYVEPKPVKPIPEPKTPQALVTKEVKPRLKVEEIAQAIEIPVWEKNLIESFNVEEIDDAPPLYDEWELVRRMVKNARYDATVDLYAALKDIPYYEFIRFFGIPVMGGPVSVYSDKLRKKHLDSIEKLAARVSMNRENPNIVKTLEVQSIISRLV